MKIVPPNFGYVEESIFRCGAPEPRHFGFLSSLNLRTCVVLTDTADEAFMRWMRESGVQILCPLLASSTGGGGGRGSMSHGGNNRESGSPRSDGRDGGGSAFARGDDNRGRADGGNGHFDKLGTGNTAGGRPADGAPSVGGDNTGGWSGSPTSVMDANRSPRSNAARFLKENNAYASPVTRGELPAAAYLRSGSSAYFGDDVNTDMTNAIGRGLMTLPEPVVVSILQVVLDSRHYPLLITCSKGRYRTGIVCGCLRKLQGWNLVSILEEYRRYAGNKSRAENEEYIELFDTDLVSVELDGVQRPSVLYGP